MTRPQLDYASGPGWSTRAIELPTVPIGETTILTMPNDGGLYSSLTVYVDPRGEPNMNTATINVYDSRTKALLGFGNLVGTSAQKVLRLTQAVPLDGYEITIDPLGAVPNPVRIAVRAQGKEPAA